MSYSYKLLFEKTYPYISIVVSGLLSYLLKPIFPEDSSLFSSALSVSGVLVGFMSTSKSILMTMSSPIIKQLQDSGYINDLASYLAQAIWINLAFCIVNILGFFPLRKHEFYAIIWCALAAGAVSAFLRITQIMLAILKRSS